MPIASPEGDDPGVVERVLRGNAVVEGIATVDSMATLAAAVDPVPWARAQMAFTLMFHIILVPLGVSWAFMTLIANYRAVKHGDRDALMLAQRWSKYMAVTFAVGAVTGTVLSFEFGLLWPRFMGQWGEAFGVPFAFEGLFFFTEAIFIAIYIFGWRRLKPWAHFWTGVPIVLAGIFGSVSVVAANAWMNAPAGFTLDSDGKVVEVDPIEVIFNDSMPLQAAHMLVAAYLVGGFLVASVYATGMLRGRRDRYHRLGLRHRRSRVAAVATPIQMGVGDYAGALGVQQPAGQVRRDRAGADDQQRRPRDPPGPPQRGRHGQRRHPDPRPGVVAVRPEHRHGDGRPGSGHGARRTNGRPSGRSTSSTSCWDVMVGLGTLLFLLSVWYAAQLGLSPPDAGEQVVPAGRGRLRRSRGDRDGGRLDRDRGRPAALDRLQDMKVEDAATGNTGVWITFIAVVVLYLALGHHDDPRAARDEPAVPPGRRLHRHDAPYGAERAAPRRPVSERRRRRCR